MLKLPARAVKTLRLLLVEDQEKALTAVDDGAAKCIGLEKRSLVERPYGRRRRSLCPHQ